MPGTWSLVKGRVRRFFDSLQHNSKRWWATKLAFIPLEDRIVPANGLDPALFQALRTAVADMNGDGVPDLLAAGPSNVGVINGANGGTLFTVRPFAGYGGPLNASAADINMDGKPEIALAAGQGGGPRVQVLSGIDQSVLFDRFVYDPRFTGGVSVALGDVTGDGVGDLITAAGYRGGPHIRIFDGATSFATSRSFFAYDNVYRGGVNLAVGDTDGDGVAEIVTGTGPGGGAHVRVFDGRTLAATHAFFSNDPSNLSGTEVGVGDVDGNGLADIVTYSGDRLRAYSGRNVTPFHDLPLFNIAISQPTGHALSVGDLDGDGFGEILLGNRHGVTGYTGATLDGSGFAYTPGTSPGTFAKAPTTPPATVFSGEAIFVPGSGTGSITASRLRAYTTAGNSVGVFPVDDATGTMGLLLPGDTTYIAAAKAAAIPLMASNGTANSTVDVDAGRFYGLIITSGANSFVSFSKANPGAAKQFRLLPGNRYAVEEGNNGGDRDFNDNLGTLAVTEGIPNQTGNFPDNLAGFTKTITGGTTGDATVKNQNLILTEGDAFRVAVAKAFTVPAAATVVQVTYELPNFDTTSTGTIRDAFEVAVLGADGTPLALPIADQRDAAFNSSEGLASVTGAGTSTSKGVISINLASLPAGTPAQVVFRLVNNDTDNLTSVVINRLDFLNTLATAPTGVTPTTQPDDAGPVNFETLADVSPSIRANYGRTTLTDENTILTTDVSLRNAGSYSVGGRVLVAIANLSDPAVGVLNADGVTPEGVPYFDFTNYLTNGVLNTGTESLARTLRFTNPNRERFTFEVQVLAGLNRAPTFTSNPTLQIEAAKAYSYDANATDPDGQTLTFALLGSPDGMTINAATGFVSWTPAVVDIGNHTVRIRVTDTLNGTAEQTFTLAVIADLPNRPPVFTSTPVTNAKVAGVFDVTTVNVGSNPVGIAGANFDGKTVSVVTANAGDANLTIGNNTVLIGEPRPNGLLLRQGREVNLGLPAFLDNNDRNAIQGAAQADLNADGRPDLVTANWNYRDGPGGTVVTQGHKLAVVLGDGEGNYGAPTFLDPGIPVTDRNHLASVQARDFDNDGKIDLVASYYNADSLTGVNTPAIFFWKGQGDGTFAAPVRSDIGAVRVGFLAAADVNADGKLDFVAINGVSEAGIILGNGDGTFGAFTLFTSSPVFGGYYYGLAVGDLDGKNGPDIVIPEYQMQRLYVHLNDGLGGFLSKTELIAKQPFSSSNTSPQTVVIGDFDSDGDGDIVYASAFAQPQGGGLGLYRNSGDGVAFTYADASREMPQHPVNFAADGGLVDFDADGKMDIVLGFTSGRYGVAVALGRGDGTFVTQVYQNPAADRPASPQNNISDQYIFTADVNRDGLRDVTVVGTSNFSNAFAGASVILADTPGVLAAPMDHPYSGTGGNNGFYGINYAADFNNDGNVDLFGLAFQAGTKIQFGNGDGTFQDAVAATGGIGNEFYGSGFSADFNADGFQDVIWWGGGGVQGGPAARVIVGFNDGTGAFGLFIRGNPDKNYYYVGGLTGGDFNGDGYQDFAGHLGYAVDVWLYDPVTKNSFTQTRLALPHGGSGKGINAADFDGNGTTDLLALIDPIPNDPANNKYSLIFFSSNGDGTFAAGAQQKLFLSNTDVFQPHWTATGDLNEDGIQDLVITSSYSRSSVFIGKGDGTFGPHTDYFTGAYFVSNRHVYLRDISGDGHLDLITYNDNRGRNALVIRQGHGEGTFGPEQEYDLGGSANIMDFADFNSDGALDIVEGTDNSSFSASEIFYGVTPGLTGVATGDFNGDGIQDTIASNGINGRVKLLFGNGDNTFNRQFDLLVGKGATAVAGLDFDGDGDLDIITANKAGRGVTVMTNNGKGIFTRADVSVGKLLTAMATGELSGDSLGDVVVASETANAIFLLQSDSAGLLAPVAIPTGEAPGKLTISDATGDGLNDVIVSLPGSKRLMILPGDGVGGFETPLYVNLKTAAGAVGVADFNADDKPDIAVTLTASGQAAILFGRGTGRFATPQTIRVGAEPGALTIQDVNSDSRPDILVANAGDGTASVIINRYDPANLYRYTAKASDADGDAVTYDLLDGPGGMLLADNGEILWAPTADQIGMNAVTVQASDGNGGSATQAFVIAVQASRENGAPNIFSAAPDTLDATKAYSYTPTSIDPDGDALRYRLLSGPAGTTVDPFTGEMTWDPRNGALQTYRDFDNVGYVQVPHVAALAPVSITLEGWYRFDSTVTGQTFFDKFLTGFSRSYAFWYQFGNIRGGISDGNGETFVNIPWTPTAGRWYHLAMTFDDATGVLNVLMDGQIIGTTTTTRHMAPTGSTLYLGGQGAGNLVGAMAQVRMWNVARTPAEIQATLLRDVAAGTPGLIFNYRFNDGDAQTVRDSSGNGVDGRLVANSTYTPFAAPGFAHEQTQYFTIQAEDGRGGVTQQSFGVTVVAPLKSSITGTLFVDADNDGIQNNGELGLAGATVFTDDNFNGYRDAGEAFAKTDAKGGYAVAGLYEGRYFLSVEPKAGYFVGFPQTVVVPRSMSPVVNLPVRALPVGQIRGRVEIDSNGNAAVGDDLLQYASDFAAAVPDLSAWNRTDIETAPVGTKFLGKFANDAVTLNLDLGLAHDELTVSFDLYILQSWDGLPDRFAVSIDGITALDTTFANTGAQQNYPNPAGGATAPSRSGAFAVNTLGYSSNGDTTYRITLNVPHIGNTVAVRFAGAGLSAINEESWGLNNVRVSIREPVAAGWPVYLDENGNSVRDAHEATAFTDASGDYAFTGLFASTWPVRIDNPAGWTTTTPVAGKYDVVLATDAVSTGNDFVIVPSADAASQPRFVTRPQDYASARNVYRFANVAIDPGFRPITYSLEAAPEGMAIDPATGVVVWTPTLDQVGPQSVILKAVNDRGGVALQSVTITVGRPNSDPIITSTPPTTAGTDVLLSYGVLAQDAEHPALGYALEAAPTGAVIDSKTGRITWTPTVAQLGVQQFTVFVEDFQGGVARQSFGLTVTPGTANTNPVILGGVRGNATVGLPLFGQILGSDADNDPITYSLVSGPAGMTVDGAGHLNWTPSPAQFGLNNVTILADDGRGGIDSQDFVIDVGSTRINRGPSISSSPKEFAIANQLYKYDVIAADLDGDPLRYEVVTGPAGLSIDPLRGTVRWNPAADQFGQNAVTQRVMDAYGATTEQSFIISVRAVGGPPAITSVPPVQAAVGNTYLYSVLAQDAENDPLTYTLLASPTGMVLDPVTGELQWTPDISHLGTQVVSIQVSDGTGGFATQTYAIEVAAGVANLPPVITSLPPISASADSPYSYTIVANDPDGVTVTFEKRRGPAAMTVNPTTGVVTWTPTAADIGTVIVAFAAVDSLGAAAVQSFELEVLAANVAPVITSFAPISVPARGLFKYDIVATDANLDPLTFELLTTPAGMTVDAFGRVRWQTAITDLGGHSVSLRVSDPRGGSVTQSFSFTVVPDTTAPTVSVIPSSNIVRANSPELFAMFNITPFYPTNTVRVTAIDNVAVTGITVTANGKPVALDSRGLATFSFEDWGFTTVTVVAKASDAAGNVGVGSKPFAFLPYGDDSGGPTQGNPQTVITSPAASDSVLGFVEIRGTATSDNFTSYTLSVRRAADGAMAKTITTGTSKISDATLGVWDTTLLENDEYILRLEVEDQIFGTTAYEQSVGVRGDFKLGNFRLSFADLTIPVAGIPITLARTYDTLRSDRKGDLGFGWRLEFRNTDLRTSLPKSNLEDLDIYTPFKAGTKVYLTLPGGQREGFTFTPQISVLPGFGNQNLVIATPRFTPDQGNRDTLQVQGGTFIVNEFGELIGGGGQPYNPAAESFGGGYTLVQPDGTRYRIDGDTGLLETVTDRNGNALTFTNAGVSGSGVNLTFERDALARITRVIDPAGNSVRYAYDFKGDLIKVTDRTGNETTFVYKTTPAHYLDRVIDPLGRTGVRTNYNADGRLSGTIGADGATVGLNYDPDNDLVTSTDPLGNITTTEYDDNGNVVSVTNPLGHTTQFVYDANNQLISSADPLGRITALAYDAGGRVSKTTDPLGHSSFFSYDAAGNLISTVDPLGRATTRTYDAKGNMLTQTDPAGAVTAMSYDTRGQITAVTDALGQSTSYQFNANGFLTTVTDRSGSTTNYTLDSLGQPLGERRMVTANGKSVEYVWGYQFDAEGRMKGGTGPDGSTFAVGVNAAGEESKLTDPLGQSTVILRDAAGRIIGTQTPGVTTATTKYDLAGRETVASLPGGGTISFQYDAAGQRTSTTLPGGQQLTSTYDAAGQQTGTAGAAGTSVSEYDDAGRLIAETTAAGRTTRIEYDAAGRTSAVIDPAGQRVEIQYDSADRVTQVLMPNGMALGYSYDKLGRLIGQSGRPGAEFAYAYNAANLVASVTGHGLTTTFDYDSEGNMSAFHDPLGRTTAFAFDSRRNITSRTTPMGRTELTTTDAAGRVTAITDFAGKTTAFTHTADGRIASRTDADGNIESYTYNADGKLVQVQNPRGIATFTYDALGLLTGSTGPDGLAVNYQSTFAGVTKVSTAAASSTMTRNADGDLLTVTDANGVTSYGYDAAGRLATVSYPGGIALALGYDAAGLASRRTYTAPGNVILSDQVYSAVNGRWVAINDAAGTSTQFTYDARGQLTREVSGAATIDYTYDSVGNVQSRTDANGTETFVVDADDRLLQAGAAVLTWNAAGNLASKTTGGIVETYQYDSRDRLIRYERTGGNPVVVTYEYDHDGLLAARTANGVVTRFVWDRASAARLPILLEERDGSGQLLVRYSNDGFEITGATYANGDVRYFLNDVHGTVHAIVQPDGTVVARPEYDAFGRRLDGGTHAIGFGNAWTDAETGFAFLRTRWYAPNLLRFISTDSAGGSPFEPRTLNRYTFAFNDPVNNSDPSGQTNLSEQLTILAQVATVLTLLQYVYVSGGFVNAVTNIFTGFSASLKFDNRVGSAFPFISASPNTSAFSAFNFGLELVHFSKFNKNVLYLFYGPALNLVQEAPIDRGPKPSNFTQILDNLTPTINIGGSVVYDTRSGDDYGGFFFGFSGLAVGFINFFFSRVNAGASAFGSPAVNMYSYSPSKTYDDPKTGEPRHSHTAGFIPFGVPLNSPKNFYSTIGLNNFNVGVSLLYYLRLT